MATAELAAARPATRPPRPSLTEAHKQTLVLAAAEVVRATASGQEPSLADPTLAGAANILVSGVFVSLKRRGHLRSCCGLLGGPVPLGAALRDAATRTAWDDVRFPSVSPSELAHLDLEVWVLFNPEPVAARGEERVGAVTVGRHGLQVVRGPARGLLLPGVAVEHQWDARRFLDQVCVKAGLHPSLWKDDATALYTFEGEAVAGRVAAGVSERGSFTWPPPLQPDELRGYTDFCRGNLWALLTGATPNYYLPGAPDGQVSGVAVTIRLAGNPDAMTVSQLSLRPGVPFQATLFSLTQAAAQALARQRLRQADLEALQVSVAVFHDPAMHGTVADPDLGGLHPAQRAVLVMERGRSGIVSDHRVSAEELVAEAARQAQVSRPEAAPVFSLGIVTIDNPLHISTAPRAVRGPAERPPGVAGTFYPADAHELSRLVDDLLGPEGRPEPWSAAMVPHAGLRYSGRVAAGVFRRLQIPSTVIVLGPKHTPLGVDWAVAPHQTWELPGATVESDFMLARQLCEAIPGLQMDALAHQREHAIEVELPFLARLAPQARVVGIAIGSGDLESCRRFAEGLAQVLRAREDRPLLLVSSDMNHFATDAENRRLDDLALAALERLDPEDVYETVAGNGISMCGVLPAVVVLETLRLLGGLTRAQRCGYATSADVTGDTSRVVGYAGMLFG